MCDNGDKLRSSRDDHFIREYAINKQWGSIAAVFKLLYSDFLVTEIPEEGHPLIPSDGLAKEGGGLVPSIADENGSSLKSEIDEPVLIPASLGDDFADRVEKLANGEVEEGETSIAIHTEVGSAGNLYVN